MLPNPATSWVIRLSTSRSKPRSSGPESEPFRADLGQRLPGTIPDRENRRVTAVTLDLGSGNRLYYWSDSAACRPPA
jgi:hypothetical protein